MAEREGFEPSVEVSPHTRLAGERLQPARPSLRKTLKKLKFSQQFLNLCYEGLAEGVGFEPTEA